MRAKPRTARPADIVRPFTGKRIEGSRSNTSCLSDLRSACRSRCPYLLLEPLAAHVIDFLGGLVSQLAGLLDSAF